MNQLDGAPESLLHSLPGRFALPESRQRASGFSSVVDDQQVATRRKNVIGLLESLDAVNPGGAFRGEGRGQASDSVPTNQLYLYRKGSYAELERCLDILAEGAPGIYWHTTARYRDQEYVTIVCGYKPSATGKGIAKVHLPQRSPDWPYHTKELGVLETLTNRQVRVRVSRWSGKVKNHKAEMGVAWLAQSMRGPVQLPVEFLEAA